MKRIKILFLWFLILAGCAPKYEVNFETSEIGSMSPNCLDSLAWEKMCKEFSIDSIKNKKLLSRLDEIKHHFIKPDYILYFKDEPEEIIGCNWYSINIAYNEKIIDGTVTGLSPFLSNNEQKRIRNRVWIELSKYQCEEGRQETLEKINEDVPFAETHKKYPLNSKSEMIEGIQEDE